MSIVKIVEDELKIDVSELISAAIMTLSIKPMAAGGIKLSTRSGYAILEHPCLLPQIATQLFSLEHAILSVEMTFRHSMRHSYFLLTRIENACSHSG